jgi:hypothetical protein
MSKKPTNKIDGTFVPLLHDTLDTPAWRATSHDARSLYVAIKRRHNLTTDNNGKIYLPQRTAEKEIGSKRDQIIRWFRELQHFGFIVMVAAGHLGVEGQGRAPRWRLTELACRGKPATRDFLLWSGAPFEVPKTESLPKTGPLPVCAWSRKRGQGSGP